jgi:diguanylate cyclase (GGDEF)-like protein
MAIALLLLAAAAAATAALVLQMRKRRAAERRAAGLSELAERLDAQARGLGDAVERARADSLRARTIGSLNRLADVDEALARCAEAAASLPSVELAVAKVEIEGVPRMAVAGADPPAVDPTRARTGVAVPLEADGRRLGSLTVYGRTGAPPVPGEELDALQAISRASAPVIQTAPESVGAKRPLVELGDRELFHESLALLAARAHRRRSALVVCVLDFDDFRLVNAKAGATAADRVLEEVADALLEGVSPTDLVCRTGGDEFAVALPGSGRIEAESLLARVQAELARRPAVIESTLGITAGIAEIEADDDGVSLFERAVADLRRGKKARRGTAA